MERKLLQQRIKRDYTLIGKNSERLIPIVNDPGSRRFVEFNFE
jgi:hypothetical protein